MTRPIKINLMSFSIALAILIFSGLSISSASAQTGSRIDSSAYPVLSLWLAPPGEISEIRRLLQTGHANDAVVLARNFLEQVKYNIRRGDETHLYFAMNALCVALTNAGELDEAISSCTRTIELYPNHWQAVNNRGTAYLVAGRVGEATADYRTALDLQTAKGSFAEVIQHNLDLSVSRLSGT